EVILQVVFGVTDEARLAQMRPLVNQLIDVNPAILFGWSFPVLQRLGSWRRMVAVQFALDRLICAEIADRREQPDLAARTDVLSRLICAGEDGDRLGDAELRDQLITLLLAGHETTATALAWALYELGRQPALMERARQAARDGDDDFLEAVVKESLRLHPVIPIVNRTLTEPAVIGGWELPAGTTVGPSILLAHARTDAYPEPERFDPDRFIGASPPVNSWIPFGGGVRRCIGAGFSLMEGVEVLRAILMTYAVEAVGTEVAVVRNITSVPARGARIRVR
ncbi:MAG: cytochrome P450, partial [Nocardioides sp.]